MDQQQEAAALIKQQTDLVQRSRTLLALLYEVAERTGRQHEAFYSLRLINDITYNGREEMPSVDVDPMGVLRGMVVLTAQVCATLEAEIDRLDS